MIRSICQRCARLSTYQKHFSGQPRTLFRGHANDIQSNLTFSQGVATSLAILGGGGGLMYFSPTDVKELARKTTFYGWTILSSILCAPSYLIFMGVYAPSQYETKLWDLKIKLDGLQNSPPSVQNEQSYELQTTTFYRELLGLRYHYKLLLSGDFQRFLETMLISLETNQSVLATMQDDIDCMSSAVNWELLRVQPVRYMWNETETVTVFGFIAMLLSGYTWGQLSINSNSARLCFTMLKSIKSQWMHLTKPFRFPLVMANLANLLLLTATYLPAQTEVDDEVELKFLRLKALDV